MKVYFKGWLTVLALALAALVIITLASQPTRAAGSWYVGPGGSDGAACTSPGTACATINGAIAKASSGDTIYVATGTYTGTGDEVVLLDQDVTLSGGWDGTFTTQSDTSTIEGEEEARGITVNSGVTATVEHFVVQNSFSMGPGGGIYNYGTLTLNNTTVSGNSSALDGGGIFNHGTLALNSSIVSGNSPMCSGGGIYNDGILTLNNSTASDNWATEGGGILNDGGTLTLNNSTVSGNTTDFGSGIYNGGNGTATLNNSTVSGNTATGWDGDGGGGIYNDSGTVTLQNTIVAGNTASGTGPDCNGAIGSSGYNLIGNTSGCTFSASTGDLLNIDARLFPLIGSPGYHPLLPGSPAIDAGNPLGCTDHLGNPLTTDQRGVARPLDGNGDGSAVCDIGAYEFDPNNNPITQVFLPIIFRNYCPPYADDFSDPGSGWPIVDTGNIQLEYLNGEYRILVKNTHWVVWARPGFKASNYIVAVDVRNATGVYGSYGIIFGFSDDWTQGYSFEIYPNGNYDIWRRNSTSSWTLLASGSSGHINTGTATNRLEIERNGSLIRAYANGQLLTSVSDGSYTGLRHVGLTASSSNQPNVDARFDNFTVTCGAAATALSGASETPDGGAMEVDLPGHWESDQNRKSK